jgi:hypothetical protein
VDIQQVIHTHPGFAGFQLAATSQRTAADARARGAILLPKIFGTSQGLTNAFSQHSLLLDFLRGKLLKAKRFMTKNSA